MMVRGMVGVVGGMVAAIGSITLLATQGEGNRLMARQPAFTITTSPARDASFLQQQARLQWGKPYIDAQLRTVGNQIFFLDPVRLALQFDAVADGGEESADAGDDDLITEDLFGGGGNNDELGLLQTHANAHSRSRMLARERLAKKRGGVHDKRALFKKADATASIQGAMLQTAADMQKAHGKKPPSFSVSKAQAALIQMTQTAEQFAKAAHTTRKDAQEDARRKRIARSVAADRAAKTKAAAYAEGVTGSTDGATMETATTTDDGLDVVEAPHDTPEQIQHVVEGVVAAKKGLKKTRKAHVTETKADLVLQAEAAVSVAREHGKRAKAVAEEKIRSGKEKAAQMKERKTQLKEKIERKRSPMPAESVEDEDIAPLEPVSQLHMHGIHRHSGKSDTSFSQNTAKHTRKTRSQMMSATRSKSAPAPHSQTSALQTSHTARARKHGHGILGRTAHTATAKDAARRLEKSS